MTLGRIFSPLLSALLWILGKGAPLFEKPMAALLYFLLFYVTKYRRKVVRINLLHAFPEKTDAEIRTIEKQYYSYLAGLFPETIFLRYATSKDLDKRFVLKGDEPVTELLKSGKKVLLFTAHLGNWEWAGLGTAKHFSPNGFVWLVYKHVTSSFFENWYIKSRSRFGSNPIEMKAFARAYLGKSGPLLVMSVADQTPSPETGIEIQFFNKPTLFFSALPKMACKTGAAVVFGASTKQPNGKWESLMEVITEDASEFTPDQLTKLFSEKLEEKIRREPWNWLWSHKRWKHYLKY